MMVSVSKHFFEAASANAPCSVMVHPWTDSCLKAAVSYGTASAIGSARFYSIVYLAQIIMRGKKMKKKSEWLKMGEYYLRSTVLGILVTAMGNQLSCLLRRSLGKFTYYSYMIIPFSLSGIFIYIEPPSRRGLIINLFCNLMIEYYLRILQKSGMISITKSKQVLVFMAGSALLFYLMRLEGDKKERTSLFWLFTPEKVRRKTDESQNVCPHEGECKKYIFEGAFAYFGIGLGISLARAIISKITTPLKAISSIRGQHFKLALFFSSYIGIYRAVICYLCRKKGFDSALYALPAGYVAGLSLLFNPNLGLPIASLTGAFKLYSTILYKKKILPASIPLPEILYCICQGTLFNAGVIDTDVCPSYVFNLMKNVSHGKVDLIRKSVDEILKKPL